MRDLELLGDVTRSSALLGQVDDQLPYIVGQRASVDERTAELVDAALQVVIRLIHFLKLF